MKKFISALLNALLILSPAITAFASGFDCTLNYNPDTLKLELNGTSKSNITVMVYESSVTSADILGGALPVAIWQYDYDQTNGESFDYALALGETLSSGQYIAKARNADGTQTLNFSHIDPATVAAALKAINDAAKISSSKVLTAFSDGAADLFIDASVVDTYGVMLSDIIYGRKLSFDSVEKLASAIDEAKAIYAVITAEKATFSSALAENASALDINKVSYYDSLSDNAKSKLITLIKADNGYKTGAFNDCFAKLSAFVAVSTASRWQDIKKAVTSTHKEIINIDTSSLADTDEVFRKMMSYTYNSFEDIAKNFALASVPSKQDKPSYGGGSSGGGVPVIGDTTGYTEPVTGVTFSDLADGHWAKASIDALVANGVLSGYPDNTFRPANSITRAEFVKMIATAFGIEGSASLPFADTPADAWYAKALSAAYSCGIISGVGNNSFMPDSFITRQDATLIIYRIIKDTLTSEGSLSFVDSDQIASYAHEAVAALSGAGIVNGTGDGSFAPKANIDRQSAAVLIYNCIKLDRDMQK